MFNRDKTPLSLLFSAELFTVFFLFSGVIKSYLVENFNVSIDPTITFLALSAISMMVALSPGTLFKNATEILLDNLQWALVILAVLVSMFLTPKFEEGSYALSKSINLSAIFFFALLFGTYFCTAPQQIIEKLTFVSILLGGAYLLSYWLHLDTSSIAQASEFLEANYLVMGRFVGFSAICLWYYLCQATTFFSKLSLSIFFSFWFFAMVVFGGRGPLISLVICLLFSFCFLRSAKFKEVLTYAMQNPFKGLLGIGVALALPWIAIELLSVMIERFGDTFATFKRLSLLLSEGSMGDSAEGRMTYYKSAWELWKKSPFVGHGIGSWPILHYGYENSGYPHNLFLEILSELGLLGLLLFLIASCYSWLNICRMKVGRQEKMFVMTSVLFFFLNAQTSNDLPGNRVFLFLLISLGLTSKLNAIDRSRPKGIEEKLQPSLTFADGRQA